MKVTVLYGKRVARLELPSSTSLTELAEGLAERFSLPDPAALKFKLQEGQPSLRVRDYPEATLESAGFTSGCKLRMSVSKHAAAAAADGGQHEQPAAAAAQQQKQQQQQGAPAAPATAGDAKFIKGQQVLYLTREGTWQEAKVGATDPPGGRPASFASGCRHARVCRCRCCCQLPRLRYAVPEPGATFLLPVAGGGC
jgi:hypothetical protein